MPRLYRQAPLNSIWEGSGNVICLDILRALGREPESATALFAELGAAMGADARYDALIASLQADLASGQGDPSLLEARARCFADKLAVALQASLLLSGGDDTAAAAELFCATRLGRGVGVGFNYGATLDAEGVGGGVIDGVLDRAVPRL